MKFLKSFSLPLVLIVAALSVAAVGTVQHLQQTADSAVLGASSSVKLGFHGATATAQRSGSAQAALSPTVGAAVTLNSGSLVSATLATNSSPYGFASAQQANAIVTQLNASTLDVSSITTRLNQLRADVIAGSLLVNELRASLVAKGIIKGGS